MTKGLHIRYLPGRAPARFIVRPSPMSSATSSLSHPKAGVRSKTERRTAALERVDLAKPTFPQPADVHHGDARIARRDAIDDLAGAVARAIVDEDDLERGIISSEQALDRGRSDKSGLAARTRRMAPTTIAA